MFKRFTIWRWEMRLRRCERLLARQQAGAVSITFSEQRFIEKLFPVEMTDAREAQYLKRWRRDAIYSLDLEVKRLRAAMADDVLAVETEDEPLDLNFQRE